MRKRHCAGERLLAFREHQLGSPEPRPPLLALLANLPIPDKVEESVPELKMPRQAALATRASFLPSLGRSTEYDSPYSPASLLPEPFKTLYNAEECVPSCQRYQTQPHMLHKSLPDERSCSKPPTRIEDDVANSAR